MADKIPVGWAECEYGYLLGYLQPTKYIVDNTEYNDNYPIPVLTAGKSFIKGYTNETHGIFEHGPVIIFDDFTTASRYVNFPFKVKSSAMKILEPSSKLVDLKFVFYSIQANSINCDTHKRYWISVYAKKKLNIPPLNEQKRIVAKIEQLFSELDKGVEALKTARAQLKLYRQALLKHAFEGNLTADWREANKDKLESAEALLTRIKTERKTRYQQQLDDWKQAVKAWEADGKESKKPVKPRPLKGLTTITASDTKRMPVLPVGWLWQRLGDCGNWSGGGTPPKSKPEYWQNGEVLWITPKDMKVRIITDTIQKITKQSVDKSSAKIIEYQSITFVIRSGILRRVLPVAVAPSGITVNQDMQAISPYFHDLIFLYWYCFSNDYQIRQECSKDGTTVESIDVSKLKNFLCPVPSLKEQEIIVTKIEEVMSVIDQIEVNIETQLKKSEALRQSILKKAFSGKLVPQDPTDEPATKLLERIKAEKATQVNLGKPKPARKTERKHHDT